MHPCDDVGHNMTVWRVAQRAHVFVLTGEGSFGRRALEEALGAAGNAAT